MASMITTVDNPYDPRTDFEGWYMWDTGQGYHTSSYLARVAMLSDEFPEAVTDRQIEIAIDEIISLHAGGMYEKLLIDDNSNVPFSPDTTSVA